MVSLTPRTQATVEDKIYKVSERITSLSYEVHMKYNSGKMVGCRQKRIRFQSYTNLYVGRLWYKIN